MPASARFAPSPPTHPRPQIAHVRDNVPEAEAKEALIEQIDGYIAEKVVLADRVIAKDAASKASLPFPLPLIPAICCSTPSHACPPPPPSPREGRGAFDAVLLHCGARVRLPAQIGDGDVILTYAYSHVVAQALVTANAAGRRFRVVVRLSSLAHVPFCQHPRESLHPPARRSLSPLTPDPFFFFTIGGGLQASPGRSRAAEAPAPGRGALYLRAHQCDLLRHAGGALGSRTQCVGWYEKGGRPNSPILSHALPPVGRPPPPLFFPPALRR